MTAKAPYTCNILLAVLLCGISFDAAPALADGCQLDIQGEGVVSAVIDPQTLRLEDGRDVRLSGVEVVAGEQPIVGRRSRRWSAGA